MRQNFFRFQRFSLLSSSLKVIICLCFEKRSNFCQNAFNCVILIFLFYVLIQHIDRLSCFYIHRLFHDLKLLIKQNDWLTHNWVWRKKERNKQLIWSYLDYCSPVWVNFGKGLSEQAPTEYVYTHIFFNTTLFNISFLIGEHCNFYLVIWIRV